MLPSNHMCQFGKRACYTSAAALAQGQQHLQKAMQLCSLPMRRQATCSTTSSTLVHGNANRHTTTASDKVVGTFQLNKPDGKVRGGTTHHACTNGRVDAPASTNSSGNFSRNSFPQVPLPKPSAQEMTDPTIAAIAAAVSSTSQGLDTKSATALSTFAVSLADTSGGGTATATAATGSATIAGAGAGSTAVPPGLDFFQRQVADKKFFCTMCGKCCTGEGEVWVSDAEMEKIAAHLNMTLPKFIIKYIKNYSGYKGWRLLKSKADSNDCIFLVDKQCSIHTVRPSQCSTYPWWPEMMSPEGWKWEKDNICEGFDHEEAGPLDVVSAALQLREASKQSALRIASNLKYGAALQDVTEL